MHRSKQCGVVVRSSHLESEGLLCALALPLLGCMDLNRFFNFSLPSVLHPNMGLILKPLLQGSCDDLVS